MIRLFTQWRARRRLQKGIEASLAERRRLRQQGYARHYRRVG